MGTTKLQPPHNFTQLILSSPLNTLWPDQEY